jgi:hypothetical protein
MALSGRCRYHAERDGVGICMRCRAVICSECSTKIEGVNHCHRCVRAIAAEAAPVRRPLPAGATRAVALLFLFLVCFALIVAFAMLQGEAQ